MGASAEWCTQCFRRLDAPAAAAPPAPPAAGSPSGPVRSGPFRAAGEAITWSCPTCGQENPVEAGTCSACGTPFGSLFREPEPAPRGDPARAAALSFVFPGLGHLSAGRTAEGLARMVAFLWMAGTAVAIVVMRRGLGLGPFVPLVLLLGIAATVIYGMSVPDARRAAQGQPPVLTTRMMMYGVSGMMLITVLVLMITSIRARG